MEQQYYTRKEVAQMVGVDHSTISRWEKKGLITPPQRFNQMYLYTDVDVENIKKVATQQQSPVPEELRCTICKRRQAKRGTATCSRCSVKKLKESLRSTLPGMETVTPLEQDEKEVEIEDINNPVTEVVEPSEKHYSRSQVAAMLNVSPSTISRWEQKGVVSLPKRYAHNNQYVYTEENVHQVLDYAEKLFSQGRSPIERAARISSKSFGKAERAVASRIKAIGPRGLL